MWIFFSPGKAPSVGAERPSGSLREGAPDNVGWRSPRANHFIAHSPLRTKPISPFGGIINFSLFERKVTKEANEPAVRSLLRPSIVPPQATFPQICGALSDFSTPRNHKILKLCSRKDSVNLTVAWCEPEPHHAPCAPRAVWAQTGLVRGDFVRRIHFY